MKVGGWSQMVGGVESDEGWWVESDEGWWVESDEGW